MSHPRSQLSVAYENASRSAEISEENDAPCSRVCRCVCVCFCTCHIDIHFTSNVRTFLKTEAGPPNITGLFEG